MTAPFRFFTRLNLVELTGRRAATLGELLDGIEQLPGAVIYCHTYLYLEAQLHLTPEPPNEFAYWVAKILQDETLGERLWSVDLMRAGSIRELREQLAGLIRAHLAERPEAATHRAPPGAEFHFMRARTFVFPTGAAASTAAEFRRGVTAASTRSLDYHLVEARLRLERHGSDFAVWLAAAGHPALAQALDALDPYATTPEMLRGRILDVIGRAVPDEAG